MSTKKPTFLRADTFRHLRLGKKRRKLQKWRRPRGHHNKLRLKRFSHPVQPGVGFGTEKKYAGKVNNLIPSLIYNLQELSNINPQMHAVILARVGAKKKLELIKKAHELQFTILNARGKSK